jgi:phosphatidate cytidylyltransferase
MTSPRLKNLIVRSVSALAAMGLLATIYLFFGQTGMLVASMLVEFLVIQEGLRLMDFHPLSRRFEKVFGAFLYILFAAILLGEPFRFQILVLAMTLGLALSIQLRVGDSLQALQNIQSRALLAMIYLTLFPALLIDLLLKYQGSLWFVSLMIMVFSGDVGAYLLGMTLGKRHVLPLISPKKTWAGALGGLLATLGSAALIHHFADLRIPQVFWLVMAVVISFVAQSGDFFESLLKRVADVKDSGSIMPGHGGILDRIDGLLFAAPVMSIALTLFDRWI